MTFPFPFLNFLAQYGASVVSFATQVDETDRTTYSFNPTLSGSFEHVIVCVGMRRNTAGTAGVSSATLNGTTMNRVANSNNGSNRDAVAVFIAPSTDTTPDIIVTGNTMMFYGQFVVLGVSGLTSTMAVASAGDGSDPYDLDANTVTGGMIVACIRDRDDAGAYSYSNTGIDAASKIQAIGSDGATTVFWETVSSGASPREIRIDSSTTSLNVVATLASLQ